MSLLFTHEQKHSFELLMYLQSFDSYRIMIDGENFSFDFESIESHFGLLRRQTNIFQDNIACLDIGYHILPLFPINQYECDFAL